MADIKYDVSEKRLPSGSVKVKIEASNDGPVEIIETEAMSRDAAANFAAGIVAGDLGCWLGKLFGGRG